MLHKKLVIIPLVCMLIFSACTANNLQGPASRNSESPQQMSNYEIRCLANDLIFKADRIFYLFYEANGLELTFENTTQITFDNGVTIWETSKDCPTMKELKGLASDVFCKRFCKEMFDITINTDNPKFKEINGTLYENTAVGGMGGFSRLLTNSMQIISSTDQKIEIELIDDMPPFRGKNMRKVVKATLILENGKWVVESYPF